MQVGVTRLEVFSCPVDRFVLCIAEPTLKDSNNFMWAPFCVFRECDIVVLLWVREMVGPILYETRHTSSNKKKTLGHTPRIFRSSSPHNSDVLQNHLSFPPDAFVFFAGGALDDGAGALVSLALLVKTCPEGTEEFVFG